jgi:hypothetical protein
MKIDAQISIRADYDGFVTIEIYDKSSNTTFVNIKMTYEQYVNASMCRLANADVEHTEVMHLDKVGKKMEMQTFEFAIPPEYDRYAKNFISLICEYVKTVAPDGWTPDLYFSSKGSIYSNKDGVAYARTTIRRWV